MNKENKQIGVSFDNTQIKTLLKDLDEIKQTPNVYRPLVIFYENRIRDSLGSLIIALDEANAYVTETKKQMR